MWTLKRVEVTPTADLTPEDLPCLGQADADTIETHQPDHERPVAAIAFFLEQTHLRGNLALGRSRVPSRAMLGADEGDPRQADGALRP